MAYHTLLRRPTVDDCASIARADAVVFASASAALGWVNAFENPAGALPPIVVAIGPTTSAAAIESGLRISHIAAHHSLAGVVDELIEAWGQSQGNVNFLGGFLADLSTSRIAWDIRPALSVHDRTRSIVADDRRKDRRRRWTLICPVAFLAGLLMFVNTGEVGATPQVLLTQAEATPVDMSTGGGQRWDRSAPIGIWRWSVCCVPGCTAFARRRSDLHDLLH